MHRTAIGHVAEWDDFWTFVRDMGERPSELHVLRRRDRSKPYGPANCYWLETVNDADKAARMRAWEAKNPLKRKSTYLKRRYGLGISEYEELLSKQQCVCAICGQVDPNVALSVDHCHDTKVVRGLLCTNCNRGIGHFRDDPKLLERAIAYLDANRSKLAA